MQLRPAASAKRKDSMNQKNGLSILARQNELTEKDWYALVDLRLEMLKKHL